MRIFLSTLALLANLLCASLLQQPAQQSEPPQSAPDYTIEAIRYANVRAFPLSSLVMGAAPEKRVDIAMVFWLIRGGGRNILFDCGFHRPSWIARFRVTDFLSPAEAVREAGLEPSLITDIIVSHAHWDHMGGLDLFPNATIWIQKAEYEYYTGEAWQPGGRKGGIDTDDVTELLARNLRGQVRLIPGDDVEILPGIRLFHRRAPHVRLAVRARGRRRALRASLGQLLPLRESSLAPRQRHV